MKIFSLIIGIIFSTTVLTGQVTFIVNSIPEYTPAEDIIYIAGSLNTWDPGNPDFALSKNDNDDWFIVLPEEADGTLIEFKFTRGDWGNVEKGAMGEEIANRQFIFGNGDSVYVDILNWADNGGSGSSTAADNVSIIDNEFYMPQLNRTRRIWIYLPPDYDDNSDDYPQSARGTCSWHIHNLRCECGDNHGNSHRNPGHPGRKGDISSPGIFTEEKTVARHTGCVERYL